MAETRPGALWRGTTPAPPIDMLSRQNLLLTRALDAVRAGDLDEATALIEQGDELPMTLAELFRLYQGEIETRTQQLEESQGRIEQALDWFANLFRLLPVAAVLVDDGGLITEANDRAEDELELGRALRSVNVPLRRLMAGPTEEARLVTLLSRAADGRPAGLDDVAMRTLSGRPRWADLRISQVPPRHGLDAGGSAGNGRLYLCVFNDRTARVEAQRAREAASAAEQLRRVAELANEAKSQLLSRVSHELRTPLNAVLGFSQLLLLDRAGMPADAQRRLQHIQAAGEHLLSLVDEVLQINRAEAGQLRLDCRPLPLEPLVRDLVSMQEPAAAEMALAMAVDVAAPAVALADARRTWEVLSNLVTNAVKYNRRDGWVRLTIGQRDGMAWVEVADSGLGLAEAQLAHLFEPFNRLGAERLPVAGHGLGLSIARTLARAMGGDIEVRSTLGRGSAFTLRLPLAPDAG